MNLDLWISPKYQLKYLNDEDSLERRINVFEDRTNGWFFDHVRLLIDKGGQHVGFSVLKLVFSYFEMIAQYIEGADSNGQSGEFTKKGLDYVFESLSSHPNAEEIKRILVSSGRNGFFHCGMTRGNFFITDLEGMPFNFEDGKVSIDRKLLPKCVFDHFEGYVGDLKSSQRGDDIAVNFEATWERVNKDKIYYPCNHELQTPS